MPAFSAGRTSSATESYKVVHCYSKKQTVLHTCSTSGHPITSETLLTGQGSDELPHAVDLPAQALT